MKKTSTPSPSKEMTATSTPAKPLKTTIEFLRQYARAYHVVTPGNAIILN